MTMKLYSITYINTKGETVTKKLAAPNTFVLTVNIFYDITDIKDDDHDNIIAIEEV